MPQGRQGSEQRRPVGWCAKIPVRDPRDTLDGEFDRQQVLPLVALVGQRGRKGRDAGLCQHDNLVETRDVPAQVLVRPADPRAGGDRVGNSVQHSDDAAMDRMAQAVQFGPRPFRQQETSDQRGVAGGEQKHHKAHRQCRWRIVGDETKEVGDQRHDAERSPARTAHRTIRDREHDQRQQGRGGERPVEQHCGERGGGEREERRQRNGHKPLPRRGVAHVRRDEQGHAEAEDAVGDGEYL